MKQAFVSVLLFSSLACAAKAVEPPDPAAAAAAHDWSQVEKLDVGTPVRVTDKSAQVVYGRIMSVTAFRLTLELEAGSEAIDRHEVALVERFPASFPGSLPKAAVGVGAALSLASSSSPRSYRASIAPSQWILDPAAEHLRNGYYVDALGLVGTTAEMVKKAIESSRTTVVVYRAR